MLRRYGARESEGQTSAPSNRPEETRRFCSCGLPSRRILPPKHLARNTRAERFGVTIRAGFGGPAMVFTGYSIRSCLGGPEGPPLRVLTTSSHAEERHAGTSHDLPPAVVRNGWRGRCPRVRLAVTSCV